MNSSLQIYRRLLTLRSCTRIISLRYSDERKFGGKFDGNEQDPGTSIETVGGLEKMEPSTAKSAQKHERSEINSLFPNREKKESDTRTSGMNLQQFSNSPISNNKSDNTYVVSKTKQEEDGFLAAYKKQEKILNEEDRGAKLASRKTETFASLLRKSTFIDLGDPVGKVVLGEIFLVVENDLYIDFGWKFHTVCSKPRKNPEKYVAGEKVLLRINDLELSAKFLGDKKYISLLEADCTVIGLPFKREENQLEK